MGYFHMSELANQIVADFIYIYLNTECLQYKMRLGMTIDYTTGGWKLLVNCFSGSCNKSQYSIRPYVSCC